MKKRKIYVLILALALIITPYLLQLEEIKKKFAALAFVLLLTPYMYTMIKSVERVCMLKKVNIERVTEGDWIERIVSKNIKTIKFSKYGISKKEIQNLRRRKVKEVIIKEGIPFVPSFFMGALVTLWLGKVIFLSWLLI